MTPLLPKRRLGIRAKLYCVAILSAASVAMLAGASLHFARTTSTAADRLYHDGFEGIESFAQLESLLEQHRRLVESAPAEVDRKELEISQREMIQKSAQLTRVINDLNLRTVDENTNKTEGALAQKIPHLIESGQDVLFYAHNFAQDKAVEAAAGYAQIADEFEQLIRQYRSQRMSIADKAVVSLSDDDYARCSVSARTHHQLHGPVGRARADRSGSLAW
jgi:uncharacterized membrane protein YgaE (UPF0421/DUF939 family)